MQIAGGRATFLVRGSEPAALKPKTLSPRLAALIQGEPLAALPKVDAMAPEQAPQPPELSSVVHKVPEVTTKPKRKLVAKPRAAKPEKKKIAKKGFKSVKKKKR